MKLEKGCAILFISKVAGKKKRYILILLLVQMVLGISSVAHAMLLRGMIDEAVGKNQSGFSFCVALFLGLIVLQILLRAVVRFLEEYAKSTYENLFKSRLFDVLLERTYEDVTAVHSGEWMNRLTSDTTVVADGLTSILPGVAGMMVKMIGALCAILYLEPRFGYVLIPGGLLLILLTYGFRKVLKKLHKKIQDADGRVRVFLQENLGSLMVIKTFVGEDATGLEAKKKMEEHKKSRIKRNHFSNICNIGFGMIMQGAYLLGVVYCGQGIIQGTVSYGTFMAVLQLIGQIQTPFANITGYLPKYYAMVASGERLAEAESFGEVEEAVSKEEIQTLYQKEFVGFGLKNAGFSYVHEESGEEKGVFRNLNLEISKGEFVAFTGSSGCGKSTLLKLFLCLYSLQSGERYIKTGDKVLSLSAKYRRLFAYVPQGNYLMSGTIREIIAFSDREAKMDEERLEKAIKIACAEFVWELENGIDTVLGERGAGLSEGQMQRIAVARAIFSKSPILILDESTSALDEETENRMLLNLKSMTDKTVLIVTHRPAALSMCNREVRI